MNETDLLERISVDPRIFGGKPIIRGRRLAVEHVLGMLAAGDDHDTLLQGYSWLEREDISLAWFTRVALSAVNESSLSWYRMMDETASGYLHLGRRHT